MLGSMNVTHHITRAKNYIKYVSTKLKVINRKLLQTKEFSKVA